MKLSGMAFDGHGAGRTVADKNSQFKSSLEDVTDFKGQVNSFTCFTCYVFQVLSS